MFSGEATGELPWWYRWVRAADRLGVPVWELIDKNVHGSRKRKPSGSPPEFFIDLWVDRILIAEGAEAAAKTIINKRAAAESRRDSEQTRKK